MISCVFETQKVVGTILGSRVGEERRVNEPDMVVIQNLNLLVYLQLCGACPDHFSLQKNGPQYPKMLEYKPRKKHSFPVGEKSLVYPN